jgi:ParB family chromosome partitioning protein
MNAQPSLVKAQIDQIVVPAIRLRPLDDAKVADIADSIKEIGLQHPVGIYFNDSTPTLVAGAHRLAAIKKLGWTEIDAIDLSRMSESNRALWEIDENLRRKELTGEELKQHLLRRKEVWDKQQAANKNNGALCATNKSRGRPKGFAESTATKIGKSKSQTNRLLAEAKATTATPAKSTKAVIAPPADILKILKRLIKGKRNLACDELGAIRAYLNEIESAPAVECIRPA